MARLHLGNKHVTPEAIEKWKAERGYDLPLLWNGEQAGLDRFSDTIFYRNTVRLFVFDFGQSDSGRDIGYDISQKRCDPPIAIATILPGQLDHVGHQSVFIRATNWHLTLRGSVLPETAASAAFRDVQFGTNAINTGTTTSGAQKFPFAASAKISLSNVRSETALRSRSFSF